MAAVRLGLWWAPFSVVHATLQRRKHRSATRRRPSREVPVALIVRRVARASRLVPRATCLIQALTAEQLLARAGHAATLRIGVARKNTDVADPHGPTLEAHAWIEHEGTVIVGGAGYDRFTPLPPLER